MRIVSRISLFLLLSVALSSCEFKCSVGEKTASTGDPSAPKEQDGALIYNGIQLKTNNVKLKKAYLVYAKTDERVPENNLIDFKDSVKMILLIDSGWKEEDGKVWLGASEKIVSERGHELLNVEDLFEKYNESGVSAVDAKILSLSATLEINPKSPPTAFDVSFRVWDKKSEAFIEGKYTLNLK